jgi:hypothetical protein
MAAFEARLVVGDAISRKEVNEMNSLVTSLALVLCARECHLDIGVKPSKICHSVAIKSCLAQAF